MRIIWLMADSRMSGVVSHERGVMASVDAKADEIGNRAKDLLRRHRDEGNAHIEVDRVVPRKLGRYGDIDAVAWLVDEPHQRPDGSWSEGDPLAIEFGHFHNFTGEWVEGLHVLYRAAGLL